MKFLANENFPFPSITILRNKGYDITSIMEFAHGISDKEVIKIASIEDRIILTFDSYYGALIFKYIVHHITLRTIANSQRQS